MIITDREWDEMRVYARFQLQSLRDEMREARAGRRGEHNAQLPETFEGPGAEVGEHVQQLRQNYQA